MSTATLDRLFSVGAPSPAERAVLRAGNRAAQLTIALDEEAALELELAVCPACSGDHAGDACPHGTALELELEPAVRLVIVVPCSAAKAPGLWAVEGEQVHTAGTAVTAKLGRRNRHQAGIAQCRTSTNCTIPPTSAAMPLAVGWGCVFAAAYCLTRAVPWVFGGAGEQHVRRAPPRAAVVALAYRNSRPRREPPVTWHKRKHE